MLANWSTPLLYAAGVVALLELVHLLLRRLLPGFRPRLLYHLWVVGLGTLTALDLAGFDRARLPWQIAAAATAVLSAVVFMALVDRLIFARPWAPSAQPMVPKLARDVLTMALLVAVVLVVAKEILDQPLGALLVSSTVLSAVVGLALQDVLRNVFAGVALDVEKPVRRGDWIMVDGVTQAQVLEMSWRSMRLRTKEGVEISEPNANVSASRIVSYGSGRRPKAMAFRVGLPYEAPPAEVKAALAAAARSAPGTLEAPPIEVFLESFDDHSIGYYMRAWTRRIADMKGYQDEVNSRIWYEIKRRGLYVPFPIRTVHLHDAEKMAEQGRRREVEDAFRLFSGLELFRELETDAVRELAAGARRHHYYDGEVMVREGESGDSLFVIASGAAVVRKASAEGAATDIEVARLGRGDFYGERSLLTGEKRSATVTVAGGTEVIEVTKEAVAPLLEHDPKIAEALSRALAARQAETAATLEDHDERRRQRGAVQDERSLLSRIRSFFKLG
ncbi:MAG: mechanosensitive ion channel family protein [Thermoanaerobaculia bacterium]|nr:mechanosensitive ion channel family protein [Thermoanaerobaculia bacterium]